MASRPNNSFDLIAELEMLEPEKEGSLSLEGLSISPELRAAIGQFVREEHLSTWVHTPNPLMGEQCPADLLRAGRENEIWDAIKLARYGEGS